MVITHYRTVWLPHQVEGMVVELDFIIAYNKGAENHHDDEISQLLTGSPTVEEEDEKEVIGFNQKGD